MRSFPPYSGLVIVLLIAASSLWFWFNRRRATQFGSHTFDEKVRLQRNRGLVVADLWFELVPRHGTLVGVAKLRTKMEFGEAIEKAVSEFPLTTGRYQVSWHGGWTVSVHEILCRDEDFFTKTQDCIPLVDSMFRGIKLAAPSHIRLTNSVAKSVEHVAIQPSMPLAPLVGRYMIDSAALGDRDVTADDVGIEIANQRTGVVTKTSLAQLQRDAQQRGIGGHPPVSPNPTVRHDSPPRPGQRQNRAAGGRFVVDIGPYLTPPTGAETYEISAVCPPYRSPAVRLIVEP